MEHVFEEKDLGVTVDSDFTFPDHISKKVKVANEIVGLIRRSFPLLDCKSFKKIFTAFVRPHLEYAQSVWTLIYANTSKCWRMYRSEPQSWSMV